MMISTSPQPPKNTLLRETETLEPRDAAGVPAETEPEAAAADEE